MIYEEFEKRLREIPYPDYPKAPPRGDFETHSAYGRAMDKYEKAKKAYQEAYGECQVKAGEINHQFETALAQSLGLLNHPKWPILYRIAWEYGHSSGYSEIENYALTLAELLQWSE